MTPWTTGHGTHARSRAPAVLHITSAGSEAQEKAWIGADIGIAGYVRTRPRIGRTRPKHGRGAVCNGARRGRARKTCLIVWIPEAFHRVLGWQHGVQFARLAFQPTMSAQIAGDTFPHSSGMPVVESVGGGAVVVFRAEVIWIAMVAVCWNRYACRCRS